MAVSNISTPKFRTNLTGNTRGTAGGITHAPGGCSQPADLLGLSTKIKLQRSDWTALVTGLLCLIYSGYDGDWPT